MADHFDTERFITEVENRRGLWDLSSNDYSNKDVKRQLWLDLTNIYGGESMEDKEKAELGKSFTLLCLSRLIMRLITINAAGAVVAFDTYM